LSGKLGQDQRYKPQSNADKDFKQAIIRLSSKPVDIFDELKKMVIEYRAQAPNTEFKEMMLDGYDSFASHYKDRKYYDDLKQTYTQMIEEAANYNKDGLYNYKEKNYKLAASSFLEVIKFYTYCCVKSEPNLASTYYNYGQSLGKGGDYYGATIFIKIALELRENYTRPKPSHEELERPRTALNTYQKKLEEQASCLRTLTETLGINQDNKPPCGPTNNPVDEDGKLYSQGMQLYRAGDYAAALNCFQQELANQKKTKIVLPNIETAILNFNIGSVYMKMQNPMAALPYLQMAFDARCQLLGPDDEATVKTKTRLEECQTIISSISHPLIFSAPKVKANSTELALNNLPVINSLRATQE